MLYVSRFINSDSYGIVDTDDDVEEIVTQNELMSFVMDYGLRIAGIATRTAEFSFGNIDYVDKIVIHQHPSFTKPIQAKVSLIYHTDIKLYKSMITSIIWDASQIKEQVSIRLSDFGDFVADRVLLGNKWNKKPSITLILDDKIKVTEKSFDAGVYGTYDYGVCFDLRELSDDLMARSVYKNVLGPERNRQGFKYIIDSEERMLEMRMSL